VTSFPIKTRRTLLRRYLDNGAIAFDNTPTPELLLPDLTRRPLPADTHTIADDGSVVFRSKRNSDETDTIVETSTGRVVCDFGRRSDLQQVTFNARYASIGMRGGFALCDLAKGKLTYLSDGENMSWASGWMDRQAQWLLMVKARPSFFSVYGNTSAALYPLPLVAEQIETDTTPQINIQNLAVKEWHWHASTGADFSPDGRWLVLTTSGKVHVMRLDALDDPIVLNVDLYMSTVLFSRDSRWLALQGEKEIYLADLTTTPRFSILTPPTPLDSFTLHDIAPDGSAFLANTRPLQSRSEQPVIWHIAPVGKVK
jgi:WD40 repeat protein